MLTVKIGRDFKSCQTFLDTNDCYSINYYIDLIDRKKMMSI